MNDTPDCLTLVSPGVYRCPRHGFTLRNPRLPIRCGCPEQLPQNQAAEREAEAKLTYSLNTLRKLHVPARHRPWALVHHLAKRLVAQGIDVAGCCDAGNVLAELLLTPGKWHPGWGQSPVEWPATDKPRIVHVMLWDLSTGGAQRMLDLWCAAEGDKWDIHVLTRGQRGPFSLPGATVHDRLSGDDLPQRVAELAPALIVNHCPALANDLPPGPPQVWIIHDTATLMAPPPAGLVPKAVFANFDSPIIHRDWRKLPLRILPLGVDLNAYRPAPAPHGGLVCGIVGRLHKDKVPESFVSALAKWQPGPWRVRFVGHGLDSGYQAKVKAAMADLPWVEFVGDVAPDTMPDALRGLDAVLIPTDPRRGESGSYAMVEAMACGLPVVARDLAGVRFNGQDVPLYAMADIDLLARLRELDNPDRRADLGRRGRDLVERFHDLRQHVSAHTQAFVAAIQAEAPPAKLGVTLGDIAHYGAALARWTAAGFPERSDAEVARIVGICKACDQFTEGRCRICRCRINEGAAWANKARQATEDCPRGKWATEPQVSILMPVYNTPALWLSECWQSILSQTYAAWELVLVDDGSTDPETVAELDRIAADPRVRLLRGPNRGIAGALNAGLSRCRGGLVARMDADDTMVATRLERQVAYLEAHPSVSILGAQMQAIEWETGKLLPPTRHPTVVTAEAIREQHASDRIWFLNHPAVTFRREAIQGLGGYPAYRVAQDLALWLKAFAAGLAIHNLPSVELHYRLHPDQATTANGLRQSEYDQIVKECWAA